MKGGRFGSGIARALNGILIPLIERIILSTTILMWDLKGSYSKIAVSDVQRPYPSSTSKSITKKI